MRIGICDDDPIWCKQAEKIISGYAENISQSFHFNCFASEHDLSIYTGIPMDIMFLDISFANSDSTDNTGISIAKKINEKWKSCSIVFVTNYLSFATDVYQSLHIYFVLKSQFENKLPDIFYKIGLEQEKKNQKIVFTQIGGDISVINLSDILFFERNGRTTTIHTINQTYSIWDNLNDIEARLPSLDFVRCHNSFIINFRAVIEISDNSFLLKENRRVPISRSHLHQTKKAFMLWCMTLMNA